MTSNIGDANNSRRPVPSLAEDLAALTGHSGRRPADTPTSHTRTTDTGRSRMVGQRDYLLPHTVHSNIPGQHYDGEPGLWAYARGLLMETCYALPWTPLALFVGVETDTDDNTTAVVLTIAAKDENKDKDRNKDIATVVWRQDYGTGAQGHDVWQLTVNGVVRHHPGSTHLRPSPPILATIIRDAITG